MALEDLNEEQKKIIKAELGTELPEVYLYKCKEDLGNEKEK